MTLEELKAAITTEWTVRIIDHGYTNDGRTGVAIENITEQGFTLRPRQPWASQGRKFFTMEFSWEEDLGIEGSTVTLYYTPTGTTSRTRAGVRQAAKSFVFSAPRRY
jgi:hypothetical protein